MAKEPGKTQDEMDSELLTAYLDGELADADSAAIEKRLAEDPSFHAHMRDLQSAWDMLDSLPLVQPNSHFVQTTVEMAIAGHTNKKPTNGIILKSLLLLLVPAIAFATSYFLKRESIEQPERELVKELPLIENHDRYDKVIFEDSAEDGIAFLKSISAKGLFRQIDDLFQVDSPVEPLNDFDEPSHPPTEKSIRERSDRLSRMTDEQLDELFDKKEKFESLNTEQQNTLREFHEMLTLEPDRNKLVEVLASYYDWLKILGMSQRAGLLDMPLNERLREIGKITRQQAQKDFGTIGSTRLPLDDANDFYSWYAVSIQIYEIEIRERIVEVWKKQRDKRGLPYTERDIDRISKAPIENLVDLSMRHDRENFGRILCDNRVEDQIGINYLRGILSDEARAIIDQPEFTEADQRELILRWIGAASQARFPIKKEDLDAFRAELSQEVRDQMDNSHPDKWHDTLKRMYWEKNFGQRSPQSELEKFVEQNGWAAELLLDDL